MDTRVELRHLRYFLAVAEERNFSRAAQRLHIAQPPLSMQIRQLEEILGGPLFVRTSRSVRLTEAGEILLRSARRILEQTSNEIERVSSVARGESGTLVFGFVSTALYTSMPDLLQRFQHENPSIHLHLHEMHSSEITHALVRSHLDLGLLRDPEPGLKTLPLLIEEYCLLLPRGHRLAHCSSVNLRNLADENFILFPRAAGEKAWNKTVGLCESAGFLPRIVQEAGSWQTIVGLVATGMGISIAPACVSAICHESVVALPLHPTATTELHIASAAEGLSPQAKKLLEIGGWSVEQLLPC